MLRKLFASIRVIRGLFFSFVPCAFVAHFSSVARGDKSLVVQHLIESYLLSEHDLLSLEIGEIGVNLQAADRLECYMQAMWEILRDWLATELRIQLPVQSLDVIPSVGQIEVWREHDAQCVRTRIEKRLAARSSSPMRDIFENYGLSITDGASLYRQGLDFLKRQSEHLSSSEQVLVIYSRSSYSQLESLDAGN